MGCCSCICNSGLFVLFCPILYIYPALGGAAVRQPETAGGGSSPADSVRNLTEPAPIAESNSSPSAFFDQFSACSQYVFF